MGLFYRGQEIDRFEWETQTGFLGQFIVILDPQVEEVFKVDKGNPVRLMSQGLFDHISCETAGGKEYPCIVRAKDRYERL